MFNLMTRDKLLSAIGAKQTARRHRAKNWAQILEEVVSGGDYAHICARYDVTPAAIAQRVRRIRENPAYLDKLIQEYMLDNEPPSTKLTSSSPAAGVALMVQ